MQISPELKQFLSRHKIVVTEADFGELREFIWEPLDKMTYSDDYIVCRLIHGNNVIKSRLLKQFLLKRNTAEAMFMIGDMHYLLRSRDGIKNALLSYKLSYRMGNLDACYWITDCCNYFLDEDSQYVTYAHFGADKHHDVRCCKLLGVMYNFGTHGVNVNLRKARHYFKLCVDGNYAIFDCTRRLKSVELKLLEEFNVTLNKKDYLLAYELKKKHNEPGLKGLQVLIENEYYKVLDCKTQGLPRVLSNLVVSYLL